MKSTYKLFGTLWDGIDDNKQIKTTVCEYKVETSMVSLSALLCASNEDDVAKLIEPFHGYDTITLDIDYHLEIENPVIKAFFEKRKRQITGYLLKKFIVVYWCQNTNKKVPSGATNA